MQGEIIKVNNIEIELERKPIKHLHLSVYPPDGRVHISAPEHYTDEQIRLYVLKKWLWIVEKRKINTSYNIQLPREYVSGEAHYFFGNLYRLKVVRETSGQHYVDIQGNYIQTHVYQNTKAENIAALLYAWYKVQLNPVIEKYVQKWEKLLNVQVNKWQIIQLNSSWGRCHQRTGKIFFNVELAKKPKICIEYIVVHELTHLIEQNHSDRFKALMTMNFPDWEKIKQQLNEFPI